MTRLKVFRPEFEDLVPRDLQEGVLYVSIKYGTARHRCCCGCGNEVVTPITPTDWSLTYDGENVSLSPSIGNWSLPCRSHYWLRRNQVQWAAKWSEKRIRAARAADEAAKAGHYRGRGDQDR